MDRSLEIAGAASIGGFSKARGAHVSRLGEPCANCETILQGPYCHVCGQLAEDFERSIGSLFVEAFENLFHADGRLWRTLPALVRRPGRLTRDYIAGKRASQVPPLRLFLVVILLFFVIGGVRDLAHPSRAVVAAPTDTSVPAHVNFGSGPWVQGLGDWLMPRARYASTHQREFGAAVESWLHRIAIIFLPIATVLLALLFVFQRRFFLFDHAIFSMHSLSFMGLLFGVMGLLRLIPGIALASDLLTLAAPVHLFAHMRGVYQTSIFGTLLRMSLLLIFSLVAIALLFFGVVMWELNALVVPGR